MAEVKQKPMQSTENQYEKNAGTHLFLFICILACIAFVAWAWNGNLAIVSVAEGEVVPSSQIKTIQHLEGGIIREIKVREGERVTKGQPLITLESAATGADVGELKTRIVGLRIEIARLQAAASNAAKPSFPHKLKKNHPQLVREANQLFESRKRRLKDELASQRAIMAQRKQDIQETTARIKNQRRSMKLLKEQIAISEDLLKEQLTNRYKHLDLLKELARLTGSIEEDKVALQRAGSALKQASANKDSIRSKFSEDARTKLDAARRQLEEFTPRMSKFEDSLKRTILRSPVKGVVKTLHVVTIGGVVRAGDAVIDIVPEGDQLIVEAKLKTQDIGYVRKQQSARITLASADAMRFDGLEGIVVRVSPDTITGDDGEPYYKVRIKTERNHFRRAENRYDLFPGMQVIASIHTGERTIMEYLLDPFFNASDTAMRER
ncbi:MAG: HlyD family type I secretion periplasmic adaptor subunit [Pseudomonadota bacterium]|nr:HlyD family type I secretion periplasmic adaptor subunit [Pseudomonadota bacterium]